MTSQSKQKSVKKKIMLVGPLLFILLASMLVFFIVQQHGHVPGSTASPTAKRVTPTPTFTATPTPSSTPQALFFDDFTAANKGWSLGDSAGYTRMLSDNSLILAATNHKLLIESLPTSARFSDFLISLTFTLNEADLSDSMGLYLRGDVYLDHDYRIDIYGNNKYAISKEYLDIDNYPQTQFLVNPTRTPLLKPVGQPNTLTVIMKGSTLLLLINGSVVNMVTDADYTSGQIALFVQNSDTSDGVAASFSSIVVYPAPERLPSN